jgi:hypothetical protein
VSDKTFKVRPLTEREEFEGLIPQWEVKNVFIFLKDNGGKCFTFGKLLKCQTLYLYRALTRNFEQFLREPLVINYLYEHKARF